MNRIIDTFAAKHLKMPTDKSTISSLSEYSLRRGYGLELRRHRRRRKQQIVI